MKAFTRTRAFMVISAVVLALVGIGAGTAYAVTTTKSGTAVARTVIHTQDTPATFTTAAFTTVGSTVVFANSGNHILVRFSAESHCSGIAGSGWCSVRILVDGVEADPAADADFAFDSTENGTKPSASWVSASMERARTVTFSGNHTITVQAAVVFNANTFRLDDWTLTGMVIVP